MSTTRMVRDVRCRSCGAPKLTKARTAYVYCDYCATLFDFDWRVACDFEALTKPGETKPERSFRACFEKERRWLEAAASDPKRLEKVWARIFSSHIAEVPTAWSPRVGDPAYLQALVADFLAPASVALTPGPSSPISELHQAWCATSERMAAKKRGFKRKPLVYYLEASKALWEREAELIDAAGLFDQHPDAQTTELYLHHKLSVIAQDWIPRLRSEDHEWLIGRLGLERAWVKVEPPTGREGCCGRCGSPRTMLEGARCAVCEHCGCTLSGDPVSIRCTGCSAALFIAPGFDRRVRCAHCESSYAS